MGEQSPAALPPRLTDAEIWRCVESTLAGVILPALPEHEEWARAMTVQLIGLVRYAASRPADRSGDRLAEVIAALEQLDDNPLVHWDGSTEEPAVLRAAAEALVAAVDSPSAAADEIRRVLRPVLIRHLDEELAVTAPLIDAFRGRLDA